MASKTKRDLLAAASEFFASQFYLRSTVVRFWPFVVLHLFSAFHLSALLTGYYISFTENLFLNFCAMKKQMPSLVFCIIMDLIGSATYALPFFGEFADIIWAPVSAFIFYRAFGGWKGAFGGLFNFVEEILPGLDFIPTFTITWLWQRATSKKESPLIKLSTR